MIHDIIPCRRSNLLLISLFIYILLLFFSKKNKSLPLKKQHIDIKNNCLAAKIALHVLLLFVFNVDFLFSVELCSCPSLHIWGRHIQNEILDLHANKITSDDVQVSEFM